jgi:hypothetical protein
MSNRALVLDANILICAVLGIRVRRILESYADTVSFFVPELALSEAQEQLSVLSIWSTETSTVNTRRKRRDGSVLAIRTTGRFSHPALALGCPIWTEDTDFFGCGVATWTSNNVEIFLGGSDARS